jgi:ankyrin repeat protein
MIHTCIDRSMHICLLVILFIKNINQAGWTPLHWACELGNEDIALVLISKGADMEVKN